LYTAIDPHVNGIEPYCIDNQRFFVKSTTTRMKKHFELSSTRLKLKRKSREETRTK